MLITLGLVLRLFIVVVITNYICLVCLFAVVHFLLLAGA